MEYLYEKSFIKIFSEKIDHFKDEWCEMSFYLKRGKYGKNSDANKLSIYLQNSFSRNSKR